MSVGLDSVITWLDCLMEDDLRALLILELACLLASPLFRLCLPLSSSTWAPFSSNSLRPGSLASPGQNLSLLMPSYKVNSLAPTRHRRTTQFNESLEVTFRQPFTLAQSLLDVCVIKAILLASKLCSSDCVRTHLTGKQQHWQQLKLLLLLRRAYTSVRVFVLLLLAGHCTHTKDSFQARNGPKDRSLFFQLCTNISK